MRIAVAVPCLNEASAIARVVSDFRKALPTSTVYVYDNGSTDGTGRIAAAAGAVVCSETVPGKGRVVRRMFAEIEADVYVLVDGDATYEAARAPELVEMLVAGNLDMVIGVRTGDGNAYRAGHQFGNRLLTSLFTATFGRGFTDVLSGFRVLSRRFVKSFPALSTEFEIETELSVHALQLGLPCAELQTIYEPRPAGSESKLRTYRDGLRILRTIVMLFKEVSPFAFFSALAGLLLAASLLVGLPLVLEFADTGRVPRFPTAILASALVVLSAIAFASGLILDSVARGRLEMKRLHYLAVPRPDPASR